MAKKKVTPHNTGLSIKRSGSKFTASWKIQAKDVEKQVARYRTYNGKKWSGWTKKKVGKGATSYSFTLDASKSITKVQVQTCILRKDVIKDGKTVTNYTLSAWKDSAATFTVLKPPTPTLAVSAPSANKTTFTITNNSKTDDHKWQYQIKYQTRYGTGAWSTAATASTTYTYTDNTTGKYREFRIWAVGPAGKTAMVTKKHYIGVAPVATWGSVTLSKKSSYYMMTYKCNLSGNSYRIDQNGITPQYYIGEPTNTMACPSGASWTDGTGYSYRDGKNTYALDITTANMIGDDECLWARVKTTHDSVDSYSAAKRVLTGKLTAPTVTVTMGTPLATGFTVDISVDDAGTSVAGAFQQVFLEKYSASGVENYIRIGSIPNGTASATITSTIDLTGETGYAIHVRNVTADGVSMVSDYASYATSMPTAPTLDGVTATNTSGKVHVSWTTNWSDATGTIIAWTDDPDNWTSNEEPETYEITEDASGWYIVGLDTGKVWYFRVRSVQTVGDSVTNSPWSADQSIDLASAPAIPVLYLSEDTITEDGMVTAYWSYVSTDSTAQVAGNVVQGTVSGGVFTPTGTVGATTDAQHIDIYAEEAGWSNGTEVYLALQTRSGSGGVSEYSTPVRLIIAAKPTVTINSTSLVTSETVTEHFEGDGATTAFDCMYDIASNLSVKVDGVTVTATSSDDVVTLNAAPDDGDDVAITYITTDNNILDDMPMTVTVTPANAETLTVALERAVDYPMDRPDGSKTEGPAGETVYLNSFPAATGTTSIALTDLLGRLDDGAWYNLVVTATDGFGQSAESTVLFKVHWSHQAWEPTATVTVDATNYTAQIIPVAGADYVSGDTCDIYRLSNDRPELIFSGAAFGTTYVDPYPAFTERSGYKIVTVTECGDYITEDNAIADFEILTDLDPGLLVIDFGGDRVELPYNITLGNKWSKDFKRTSYLGGHVAGDYNRAILRDVSAGTVLARDLDEDTAMLMHELADYAGSCHVRTPDGSSFEADVQVSEDRAYNSGAITYSLTIQKTDTTGFDAMTLADWNYLQ